MRIVDMKTLFSFFLLLFSAPIILGQNAEQKIDSLEKRLAAQKEDTTKIKTLIAAYY